MYTRPCEKIAHVYTRFFFGFVWYFSTNVYICFIVNQKTKNKMTQSHLIILIFSTVTTLGSFSLFCYFNNTFKN